MFWAAQKYLTTGRTKNTKKDIFEITCYKCWVNSHYAKDCKDLKQSKLEKKDEKSTSKKHLKIKTDSAAAVTPCESKRVIIVNDDGTWSTRADNDC